MMLQMSRYDESDYNTNDMFLRYKLSLWYPWYNDIYMGGFRPEQNIRIGMANISLWLHIVAWKKWATFCWRYLKMNLLE